MEIRDFLRPIITGLVALGFVILIIVVIIKLFTGHGVTPTNTIDLGKYANTDASATLLIDAPTNIDQDHRQIRITVSATQNEIDILQGYQGTIIASQTYPNNGTAFAAFLQSLKVADYAKGTNTSADYRGYCPFGDRYLYSFNNGSKDLFKYWSTTCHQGTYKGQVNTTLRLFQRQIPEHDYSTLTHSIATGF